MTKRLILARSDSPPPAPTHLQIRRIEPGEPVTVTVLSPKWEGWNVHWFNGRTYPCRRPKAMCLACEAKVPQKWRGFLHVVENDTRASVLMEFTRDAALRMEALRGELESFRGMVVSIKRANKNIRSPYRIHPVGYPVTEDRLPAYKSAEPTVLRLWGAAE